MDWKPISEAQLWDLLNSACDRMTLPQRRLWEVIRLTPEKWKQHPYGDVGQGFWAVGILGNTVIWYNDIEDGFNHSRYKQHGLIEDYWCNQDCLEWAIEAILHSIENGFDSRPNTGAPEAVSVSG